MSGAALLGPGTWYQPGPATLLCHGAGFVVLEPGADKRLVDIAWDALAELRVDGSFLAELAQRAGLDGEHGLPPVIVGVADSERAFVGVRGAALVTLYGPRGRVAVAGEDGRTQVAELEHPLRIAFGELPDESGVGGLRVASGIVRMRGFVVVPEDPTRLDGPLRERLEEWVVEDGRIIEDDESRRHRRQSPPPPRTPPLPSPRRAVPSTAQVEPSRTPAAPQATAPAMDPRLAQLFADRPSRPAVRPETGAEPAARPRGRRRRITEPGGENAPTPGAIDPARPGGSSRAPEATPRSGSPAAIEDTVDPSGRHAPRGADPAPYDDLFGATQQRRVEDAAVRNRSSEPPTLDLEPEEWTEPEPREPAPAEQPPAAGRAETTSERDEGPPPRSPGASDFIDWVPGVSRASAPSTPPVSPAPASPAMPAADRRQDVPAATPPDAPAQPRTPVRRTAPAPVVRVPARVCAAGHPSPPENVSCRTCGAVLEGEVRPVDRPPLGTLDVSSGPPVIVDRTVVIGRRPRVSRVSDQDVPLLVTVASPQQDISRSHLEVRPEGWHVVAVDLAATNGTLLHRAGQGAVRLRPHDPVLLAEGDVLDIGDGVTLRWTERT